MSILPIPSPILSAIGRMQHANAMICVKHRDNSALRSAYANLADVWEFLRPMLNDHGLAVSFSHGRLKEVGAQYVLEQTMTVYHEESASSHEHTGDFPLPEGNRGVNFAQRFGSAKTYAERYALTAFFGVITGDDDDAARAAAEPRKMAEPGAAAVACQWQELLEDQWKEMSAPGPGSLTCGELSVREMREMRLSYPEHPALCASLADGISAHVEKRGHTWETAVAEIGGTWPRLLDMTPNDLHAFADKVRTLSEKGGGL